MKQGTVLQIALVLLVVLLTCIAIVAGVIYFSHSGMPAESLNNCASQIVGECTVIR